MIWHQQQYFTSIGNQLATEEHSNQKSRVRRSRKLPLKQLESHVQKHPEAFRYFRQITIDSFCFHVQRLTHTLLISKVDMTVN